MAKQTQSQFVTSTCSNYIREHKNETFEVGVDNANDFLTRDDKSRIAAMLAEAAANDPSMRPSRPVGQPKRLAPSGWGVLLYGLSPPKSFLHCSHLQ